MRRPHVIFCNIEIFAGFVALPLLNPIALRVFGVGLPVAFPVVRVLDSPVSAILNVIRAGCWLVSAPLRLRASASLALALGVGTELLVMGLRPGDK